jgi:hypothetical protein
MQGRFDGADWNLSTLRAQSAYGAIEGWARGSLDGSLPRFALDIPRLQVPMATVNRLLAPRGVALDGAATARVRLEPASGAANAVRTRFSVNLPRALLRNTTRARSALARLENATLRGEGVLHLGARLGASRAAAGLARADLSPLWRFEGEAGLSASSMQLARTASDKERSPVPAALRGTSLRNVHLNMRGGLAADDLEDFANGFALLRTSTARASAGEKAALAGEVTWQRASLPMPTLAAGEVRSKPTVLPALLLGEGRALFRADARSLRIPRFSTRVLTENADSGVEIAPDTARFRGWASLESGNIAAQVLAEHINAARAQGIAQNILGARARLAARVRGIGFARCDIAGTVAAPRATLQLRLVNGAIEAGGRTLPLDSARANLNFAQPDLAHGSVGSVTVREAVLWSRGGRFSLAGTMQSPDASGGARGGARALSGAQESGLPAFVLDLAGRADDVRLSEVAALVSNRTGVDGLASGNFRLVGTLAQPRLRGDAAIKLAAFQGIVVDEASAQVRFDSTPDGPRLALEDITGRSGVTRLAGRLLADVPADQWRFALHSEGIDTTRVLRAARRATNETGGVPMPLRGDIAADIDVQGRFGAGLTLVPLQGGAQVRAASLRWRGHDLGELGVDASLDGQKLRLEQLSLRDPKNPASPTLTMTGTSPLEADVSGLDMRIEARKVGLELLRAVIEESRRTLREVVTNVENSDNAEKAPQLISVANSLDVLMRGWDALPQKLDGQASVDAQLSGSLTAPVADVTAHIREAKLGTQPFPVIDAAVRLEDGVATVRTLELKQTEPAATPDDDPRETVMRFSPGGRVSATEVSLDGELLNANLSQLAPWVRSLRDANGNAVLQGEVSLFNFQLRGSPQKPLLTGSLEAQKLVYRAYTIDRLRLARFDILGDAIVVAPGNFTVVKGGFQSSAAYGRLPWNWGRGIDFDRTLEVHLPVERRDFGALVGAFVPAVRAADADGFEGSLDIGGTLLQPRLAGELRFQRVRFATDASTGADVGVRDLSGALRFGENNTLQLDNLRGELTSAGEVEATSTGNRPASERNPTRVESVAAKNSNFAGAFALNGSIALQLDPAKLSSPARFVAAQRYDVTLNIDKAAFWRPDISGVRDVTLDAAWKTGAGDEETAQRLTWQFSAAGRELSSGKNKKNSKGALGTLRSAGTAVLNLEEPASSRWNGTVTVRAFGFEVLNTARGRIDGDLELVNMKPRRATDQLVNFPRAIAGFSLASLEERLRLSRSARRSAQDSGTPQSMALAETGARSSAPDRAGQRPSTVEIGTRATAVVAANARVTHGL